jgi:hypothetical protein
VGALLTLVLIAAIFQGVPLHMEYFRLESGASFFAGLKDRHFFSFFMSLVIPFGLMIILTAGIFKRRNEWTSDDIFLLGFGIYGLSCYVPFCMNAVPYGFYWAPLGLTAILSFWFKEWTKALPSDKARVWKGLGFVIALGALLTNILFSFYPNVFNHLYHP